MKNKQYRQGDVLIERVAKIVRSPSKQNHPPKIVLAEGEATGHAHVLNNSPIDPADWWKDGDQQFMNLATDGVVLETNTEVRRVKIDRYGPARYLVDAGAVEVHRDDFGILYRREAVGDEPLVMVKVVNSTPETDGTFKDYFLRVPPVMQRARQAIAWTFGKEEREYAPEVQT